ncbi:class II glutamine amidotransferase [Pseudenhygromyxa sp. WMMC2535]|uniref:class II glutamine amidotransferase n=1 Tax=Pseudenhygromyxa sp. WMMC2535 TaxID=2712867 RepID=UPI0015577F13|nr:class II glutamine amidotransferase [Pseudenhygromyxa sp. WMMC2535]NVB36916.1 class II glutamine amidotransferase [Pseudenhygromyxa sp. WMMC2535]
MCRIFGFRSVMQSQVHRSLVSADNALMHQSERNPDGWGVAYYLAGAPHVVKSVATAVSDEMFRRVSGVVTSETVLAHVRKATQGQLSILDTHPFQFGNWVMVHNGNIANFPELRDRLLEQIPPVYSRFILGRTDSELLFYTLLAKMAERCELGRRGYPLEDLAAAAREALAAITELAGELCPDTHADPLSNNFLTFVITNGQTMLAHQGGKQLQVSTHKANCPERDSCPYWAKECERRVETGFVSHLVFSSEPLLGDNVWEPMRFGEMIGVDWRMQMRRFEP